MNTSPTKTITLPCGTVATVAAFNSRAQEYINSVVESAGAGEPVPQGWQENLLREVVKIDGKTPSENDLLTLASGSRSRLLVESRRLTFGDDVKVEAACRKCGARTSHTINLSKLTDHAYPAKLAPHTFTTSQGTVVTIGWGTGHTERMYTRGKSQKQWGAFDEPLARVTAMDGEAKGPRWFHDQPAALLEEIRKVGWAMVPRLRLSEPTEPATVPFAGITETIEVECQSCPATYFVGYGGAEDFLLRGALAALD